VAEVEAPMVDTPLAVFLALKEKCINYFLNLSFVFIMRLCTLAL
jgi:hypothetical protein